MQVNCELNHPDDMEAFAAFLTASAASRRKRPLGGLWSNPLDYGTTNEDLAASQAEQLIPEEQAPETTEAPKRTRRTRRTKAEIEADKAKAAETVANLDPEVVAAAEAAGVHVQAETAEETNAADEPELPLEDKQVEEQPALTENDVRNAIIDLLNEAQAKFPADADVRTKTLAPILSALGAQKISLIPMTEYPRVAGILAKARADMDAALAEAA